jgi:ABC-type antimicrobial peptide transport system permease subunit
MIENLSPDGMYFEITTVDKQVMEIQAPRRFEFAGLATLLAATGVYGLLHYAVAQKRKEIGIRLALGARNSDVVRHALSQGLRGVALGLLVGMAVSYAATRVLANVLYGVTATDPITFAGVVILFDHSCARG